MITRRKLNQLLATIDPPNYPDLVDFWNECERVLIPRAKALVKTRIKGQRKGIKAEPNYTHSLNVYKTVDKLHHWDYQDYNLFMAALLHDVVEDGGVSFEELVQMGFPKKTIELVYLCTHDKRIKNHTARWLKLIDKLVDADVDEAWLIKMIDLAENLKQSHGLSKENRKFMIEVKGPLIMRLTEKFNNWPWQNEYFYYLYHALELAKKKFDREGKKEEN